jgi:hypothetical protein
MAGMSSKAIAWPVVITAVLIFGCASKTPGAQKSTSTAKSSATTTPAKDPRFTRRDPPPPIVGRWDVTLHNEKGGEAPSWFEVAQSGYRTLVGTYVGNVGSARPIGRVDFDDATGRLHFAVPPQWERRTDDIVIDGKLQGDALRGTTTDVKGKRVAWEARRAPVLNRTAPPQWAEPVELFNGRDLSGWKTRWSERPNGWLVMDGLLVNAKPGNDLLTDRTFADFKLRAEFRYPRKSNSGIYLRGRYEAQIEDTAGREIESHIMGGIYGFLTPSVNAAKPPGEWQTIEITLVGRAVTIVLNGERVLDRQAIPGITGGALDSDESAPGPIMLQGDHGPIEFRKLTLTPAK